MIVVCAGRQARQPPQDDDHRARGHPAHRRAAASDPRPDRPSRQPDRGPVWPLRPRRAVGVRRPQRVGSARRATARTTAAARAGPGS